MFTRYLAIVAGSCALAVEALAQAAIAAPDAAKAFPCIPDPNCWRWIGDSRGIISRNYDFLQAVAIFEVVEPGLVSFAPLLPQNAPPKYQPTLPLNVEFANYISTPNDVPNTTLIGSPNSTLSILSWQSSPLSVVTKWADASLNPGEDFVMSRLSIEYQKAFGDLTLQPVTPEAVLVATAYLSLTVQHVTTLETVTAELDFQVYQEIPEPGGALMLAAGMFAMARRRR